MTLRLFTICLVGTLILPAAFASVEVGDRVWSRLPQPREPDVLKEALQHEESTLREELAKQPDSPLLLHRLGTILSHLGKAAEAREYWGKAASLDPNLPPADLLARMQKTMRPLREGKTQAAQAELTALEKDHGKDPHFYLAQAEQAINGRNLDAAERAFKRACELGPDLFVARLNLASFYQSRNRHELARDYYLEAIELAPKRPGCRTALAIHQFKQGQLADALESFRAAEKLDPQEPLAEVPMARLHVDIQDFVGARRWYQAALARQPKDDGPIRTSLSRVQMRLGLLDEAKEQIETVLADKKDDVSLLAALAVLEQTQGDLKQAEKHYRRVLRLDPGNVLANNNLAMLLLELNRSADEALKLVEAALEKAPQSATVLTTHACALLEAKQHDAARKALANAVRFSPSEPWVRYSYGKLLCSDGELEEGRTHLEGCLILDADFPRKAEVEKLLEKAKD